MKCVGLLLFAILLQNIDRFLRVKSNKWTDEQSTTDNSTPDYENLQNTLRKASINSNVQSKFSSVAYGIAIPDDLKLTVPLSDISVNWLNSFRGLQGTLSDLSNSTSTVLPSVAQMLLLLVDKSVNLIGSSSEDASSLTDVVPTVFSGFTDVISSLKIGTGINDAVNEIKRHLLEILKVLNAPPDSESIMDNFNLAVLYFATSVQVIGVSVAVICESSATKMGTLESDAMDVVLSLELILHAHLVILQSVCYSIASIAASMSHIATTSSLLNCILVILDQALPPFTHAVTLIPSSIKSSMALTVSSVSVTLTSVISKLNLAMEKVQASLILQIPATLEDVFFRLIGTDGKLASSVTTSVALISTSISVISSSVVGLQSKMCAQMYQVIRTLASSSASENEIIKELEKKLPPVFDVLKVVSATLVFGFGFEVVNAIVATIEEISVHLKKAVALAGLDSIDEDDLNRVTEEIAKNVQVLNSVVVAITKTISEAFNAANTVAFEAVIALQVLHATVLYAVEWTTCVVASAYKAQADENTELLSSLAAIIVVMLKHSSTTMEMIAGAATNSLSEVVGLIAAHVIQLNSSSANDVLTEISRINANTTVSFGQMESSGGGAIPVEGLVSTADGNLSQIFDGLTGPLSSISSSFSSSLDRLRNALKQINSSDSKVIQAVSILLTLVVTYLSEISGPATQILSLTSTYLNIVFGRLLEASTVLSFLGDISVSFGASVSQVSSALFSLIHSIDNYQKSPYFVIDSVRELTKNVQVVISIFSAIVKAASKGTEAVIQKTSVPITALLYIVSGVALVVQQVVAATILKVSAIAGSITQVQQSFSLVMSEILATVTSITAVATSYVVEGKYSLIPGKIVLPVSDLQNSTSMLLSKISGVVANYEASLTDAKAM